MHIDLLAGLCVMSLNSKFIWLIRLNVILSVSIDVKT